MSSGMPLFLSPCVLRKGSRLFSLCLSSRKSSGLGGQAQCLDTDVAEPGSGLELIVLCLATAGGYFCFCCLILSDIVSVPSRGRCVCVCCSLSRVHCSAKLFRRGNHRPPISTEIVYQLRSHHDKDCFLTVANLTQATHV